ncbi:hypothetical protein [Caminibacter mediatlanticus]|uniref:Uncharacterized protein n=1 Tax=Caminibacter mediatlanticus TB-2 TaxID=391592 RepID=A0AAI9AG12_9BACT|nr:hypothetical protein [Caminibacter mediatlanticus]EDM22824.1 hypothetical protein CMTB2_09246 [Caminibacter mediatlanticus TB-2]
MLKIKLRSVANRIKIDERNLYNWRKNKKEMFEALMDFTALEYLAEQNVQKIFTKEEIKLITSYLLNLATEQEGYAEVGEIVYSWLMDLSLLKTELLNAMVGIENVKTIETIKYKIENNPLGIAEWYVLFRIALNKEQEEIVLENGVKVVKYK